MSDRLKYTVKTHLNEEDNNNLTTILEEQDKTQEEYIRESIKEILEKDLNKYKSYC